MRDIAAQQPSAEKLAASAGAHTVLIPLRKPEQDLYLSRYRAAIEKLYPALPDGVVLLPFPRLFLVATR